jgi:hypothetical protein
MLYSFISNKGVKVVFGLSGLPGYLENLYFSSDPSIRNSKEDRLINHIKVSFSIVVISAISLFLIRIIS